MVRATTHRHAGGKTHRHPVQHFGSQGVAAVRPLPQTTEGPPGGDFQRHTRKASRPGYSVTSAFGATVDQALSSAPGYLRYLEVTFGAIGGAAGGGSVTALAADAAVSPAAFVQFMQFKDSFGTVVYSGGGFELLYLVPLYSGQLGLFPAMDLRRWPSFSAPAVGANASGNFNYHCRIPFEITPTYGCIAIGNSALQPTLHWAFSTAAQFYSTPPNTTVPPVQVTVDENYYMAPSGQYEGLEPPGLGTTLQWIQYTANPPVGTGSSLRVAFPRIAGFLTIIILEARDSTGARSDAVWPASVVNGGAGNIGTNNRIRLYLDGVPVADESFDERVDKMFEEYGGAFGSGNLTAFNNRPAGVIVYQFKASESQVQLGLLDSLETVLSTNPGTLIEVECTPWGTQANTPATITAVVGSIVPKGGVRQGLQQ